MHAPDPGEPAGLDDHCLVHQFIRTHGRRPTAEELRTLGDRPVEAPPVVQPPRSTTSRALSGVRRELARFVHRL